MLWRDPPEAGTPVCLGFDGSEVDDWTALRAETIDGYQFTPRHGADGRPTVWDPAEHFDHRTPRPTVMAAVDQAFETYRVERAYFDPPLWTTEIDDLARRHGDERVIRWETYRLRQMHAALERFFTDLRNGRVTHDGCPVTARHIGNARKVARGRDQYILEKPNRHQKIDAAMASVLAHEAAADARAAGWDSVKDSRVLVFRR